jgi:DNA polymerase-3 subunit delta'
VNLAPWHVEEWSRLAARREQGRLPHALLLCGPEGLGKRAFAGAFAAALLCQNLRADATACGACRACRLVQAGSHPDLVRVGLGLRDDGKPRTEIVVEQIRALGQRLALTAQFGGHQIALIDPADAMNINTSNALLKTLEEPTPATLIGLVADQPARLPATIRSRCQRIDFRIPSLGQAQSWLKQHGVDAKSAAAALDASGGNPGLALTWANAGGLALRDEVSEDLRGLCAGRASAVEVANRWSKSEAEPRLWFAAMLLHAQAQAQAGGAAGPLGATACADVSRLSAWFDNANRARAQLRGPLRPELVLLEALAPLTDR